jgi:hypothetical protein
MEKGSFEVSGKYGLIVWCVTLFLILGLSCDAWSLGVKKRFTKFNTPGILHLTGKSRMYDVNVPVPKRWIVDNALLTISYVNSDAVFSELSRLVILVNGYPVAQVRLEANAPEGTVSVNVPGRLFKTGYNKIRFMVFQTESNDPCTSPDQPEVWTDIKFVDSYLDMSYTLKEIPRSLASIADFLYDPRMFGENTVHIVVENMSNEWLELATLAASGISVRFDYRPVHFSLGSRLKTGMDMVIIGSREFIESRVRRYARDFKLKGDLGIFYGVKQDPLHKGGFLPDRQHGLIYITGENIEKLVRNTRAFALVSWPMPDMPYCVIDGVILPEITRYSGKRVLAPEREYTFRELGWHTTTFYGYKPLPSDMSFIIPSDLELPGNRNVEISMNIAYASKMREDSVLSILLNRKYVASIPLDSETGAIYRRYKLRVPASYFKKGLNVITLSPALIPFHTGECELIETDHLAVTVKDDSTIMLPALQHWTELPDLENVFDDGFPLTVSPDFRDTCLVVASDDLPSMEAAVELVGMISQKRGVPAFRLNVAREIDDSCKRQEILVTGEWNDIPPELIEASPLVPELLMPFAGRLPGTLRDISFWDRVKEEYAGIPLPLFNFTPDTGKIVLKSNKNMQTDVNKMLVAQFESPYRSMRSVVMVTALSSERLLYGVRQLQIPEVKVLCQKGITVLDFSGKKPEGFSVMTESKYFAGSRSAKHWIDYVVSRHLVKLLLALSCFAVILSGIIIVVLKKMRKKKLEEYE